MEQNRIPPLVLCILDGWGENKSDFGNAIKQGSTPVLDRLNRELPPIYINASSHWVGLPDGQMGNSEVGHLNIGAGRMVMQELPRINRAIKDGTFFHNRVITEGINKSLENSGRYHLLGLVSDGGVHSHINHLEAFLKKAKNEGQKEVYIHAFTDGRDTPPKSGVDHIRRLVRMTHDIGIGKIASVSGRYWGMDRDNRWDRVQLAFGAIVHGNSEITSNDPVDAVLKSYEKNATDEFIRPTVITDEKGEPVVSMADGDIVQVFNFRADRVRQMVRALIWPDFTHFNRGKLPRLSVYCMTEYAGLFNLPVAFEKTPPEKGLGEVLSSLNISQFRTAETEKYAHVTYFFNGGIEKPFERETRKLVPSPSVSTYDLKPEMSAYEVADNVVATIRSGNEKLIVVNFANGDMVGHTGMFDAALKAVDVVDTCVNQVIHAVRDTGGWLIITADHGNIEEMITKDNKPMTYHTTNLVPFYVIGPEKVQLNQNGGALCDVAPTILSLMKIPQPDEMTGKSLIISQ